MPQNSNSNLNEKHFWASGLTRFSQNSNSKDLSPLKISHIPFDSSMNVKDLILKTRHGTTKSAVQAIRKNSNYSPFKGKVNHVTDSRRQSQKSLKLLSNDGRRISKCRSVQSISIRSTQSSPERLVNIVCPRPHGRTFDQDYLKRKLARSGLGRSSLSRSRPRSEFSKHFNES